MLGYLTLIAAFSAAFAAQKQSNFMMKDWEEGQLLMTHEVDFEITVPQWFRRNRKFNVTIGLFGKHVPFTVSNFAQLAAGGVQAEVTDENGDNVTRIYKYEGTRFYRIEKDISIQGGDVVFNDGTGSITRYHASAIEAENYDLSNYGMGWVGMVHNGPEGHYGIGCQFYICMTNDRAILHKLNQEHFVVIGKVIKGIDKLVKINKKVDSNDRRGKIKLDKTIVPETGYPLNRPERDIIISKSVVTVYPEGEEKTTTNRPSKGSLFGEWPVEGEGERQ